jgi:hypothetical protein
LEPSQQYPGSHERLNAAKTLSVIRNIAFVFTNFIAVTANLRFDTATIAPFTTNVTILTTIVTTFFVKTATDTANVEIFTTNVLIFSVKTLSYLN